MPARTPAVPHADRRPIPGSVPAAAGAPPRKCTGVERLGAGGEVEHPRGAIVTTAPWPRRRTAPPLPRPAGRTRCSCSPGAPVPRPPHPPRLSRVPPGERRNQYTQYLLGARRVITWRLQPQVCGLGPSRPAVLVGVAIYAELQGLRGGREPDLGSDFVRLDRPVRTISNSGTAVGDGARISSDSVLMTAWLVIGAGCGLASATLDVAVDEAQARLPVRRPPSDTNMFFGINHMTPGARPRPPNLSPAVVTLSTYHSKPGGAGRHRADLELAQRREHGARRRCTRTDDRHRLEQ